VTAKERDDVLGLAGVVVLAAGAWIAWTTRPVFAYLAAAFALAWTFHRWKIWAARPANKDKSIAKLGRNASEELRDTALAIAAGTALVVLAQVALTLSSKFVADERVWTWEQELSLVRIRLDTFLSVRYLLVLFVAVSLLPLAFPGLRLVPWVQDRLRLLARVATALTAATSFTFFAAGDVRAHERDWVAGYKNEVLSELQDTMKARRELVASAIVQKQVASLSPQSRTNLAALLKDVSGKRTVEMRGRLGIEASEVVRSTPVRLDAAKEDAEESIFEGLTEDARIWMRSGDSMGYSPSLKDIRNQIAPLKQRLELARDQMKSGAVTMLSSAMSEVLSAGPESLQAWTDALVEAWTNSLSELNPKDVHDQASAESFLERSGTAALRQPLEIPAKKTPDSKPPNRPPRPAPYPDGPDKDRKDDARGERAGADVK